VLITLLTDFGLTDPYVAMMKGAILSVEPRAQVIDLTHEVPRHDIATGAFLLERSVEFFPSGTVHLAVVDPGVGTERRPLLIRTRAFTLVGPDNGLLSLAARAGGIEEIVHLTEAAYFRSPLSATFHGRDLFAPVAAHCAAGVPPASFGPPVKSCTMLRRPSPRRRGGELLGAVLLVDRFGNCITNIERRHVEQSGPLVVHAGGRRIDGPVRSYHDAPADCPAALWGSYGLLEIAWREDSAARRLGLRHGAAVRVQLP